MTNGLKLFYLTLVEDYKGKVIYIMPTPFDNGYWTRVHGIVTPEYFDYSSWSTPCGKKIVLETIMFLVLLTMLGYNYIDCELVMSNVLT